MTEQRIGSCSICGGDVVGHVGAWWGVIPPPPPQCTSCGARTKDDTIEMVPRHPSAPRQRTITRNDTGGTNGS